MIRRFASIPSVAADAGELVKNHVGSSHYGFEVQRDLTGELRMQAPLEHGKVKSIYYGSVYCGNRLDPAVLAGHSAHLERVTKGIANPVWVAELKQYLELPTRRRKV